MNDEALRVQGFGGEGRVSRSPDRACHTVALRDHCLGSGRVPDRYAKGLVAGHGISVAMCSGLVKGRDGRNFQGDADSGRVIPSRHRQRPTCGSCRGFGVPHPGQEATLMGWFPSWQLSPLLAPAIHAED